MGWKKKWNYGDEWLFLFFLFLPRGFKASNAVIFATQFLCDPVSFVFIELLYDTNEAGTKHSATNFVWKMTEISVHVCAYSLQCPQQFLRCQHWIRALNRGILKVKPSLHCKTRCIFPGLSSKGSNLAQCLYFQKPRVTSGKYKSHAGPKLHQERVKWFNSAVCKGD